MPAPNFASRVGLKPDLNRVVADVLNMFTGSDIAQHLYEIQDIDWTGNKVKVQRLCDGTVLNDTVSRISQITRPVDDTKARFNWDTYNTYGFGRYFMYFVPSWYNGDYAALIGKGSPYEVVGVDAPGTSNPRVQFIEHAANGKQIGHSIEQDSIVYPQWVPQLWVAQDQAMINTLGYNVWQGGPSSQARPSQQTTNAPNVPKESTKKGHTGPKLVMGVEVAQDYTKLSVQEEELRFKQRRNQAMRKALGFDDVSESELFG